MFTIEDLRELQDIENPIAQNSLNSKELFYWRSVYKEFSYPKLLTKHPIDLWYDNPLLGKVDPSGYPVYILENALKQIPSSKNQNAFALQPVASAWIAMSNYVSKNRRRTASMIEKSLYHDLDPVSAWVSPLILYSEYNNSKYDVFIDGFLTNEKFKKIITFDDYLKEFLAYVDGLSIVVPFTREGWIMSKLCPQSIGGTIIEISDKEKSIDRHKSKFFKDPYFGFISETAEKFGFIIDKNAPWRFVANFDSDSMKNRISRKGLSEKTLFQVNYRRTYTDEIFVFFHHLWDWYNELVIYNPTASQEYHDTCSGSTKISLKSRRVLGRNEIWASKPLEYWLRLYIYVRAREERKEWNQPEFEKVVSKTLEYLEYKNINTAFQYLRRKLSGGLDINRLYLKENLTEEEKSVIMSKKRFRTFSKGTFSF
jgi:hypothetical protein